MSADDACLTGAGLTPEVAALEAGPGSGCGTAVGALAAAFNSARFSLIVAGSSASRLGALNAATAGTASAQRLTAAAAHPRCGSQEASSRQAPTSAN